MGKIACAVCKKSCKGQAIRLQERYFHVKCFRCDECKKQLATGGFYTHNDVYYCQEDYQRMFGTKCTVCDKFVEGEVVTALGNTYHIDCFHCTRCNEQFTAGDKVTFTGKEYLCGVCLDQTQSSATTPATEVEMGSPSKKAKAPLTHSTPRGQTDSLMDTQLSSPMSDMSDISTDKENIRNGMPHGLMSPLSTTSGYKSDASSDRGTHDRSSEVFDDFLGTSIDKENAKKSKPLANQSEYAGAGSDTDNVGDDMIEILEPVPASDQDDSDKERLSPIHNIMAYRSPSPAASSVSKGTRESSASYHSRFEVDYGKFYNTSYLEKTKLQYKRGPSININQKPRSPHFHRPENFSYTQVRKDFIRPIKKEDSSMLNKLGDTKYVLKKKEPIVLTMNNKEPIAMSKFPDAHKPEPGFRSAIEREDWPAPPAPAAAFPELLREKKKRRSGRRSTATSGADTTDGETTEYETEISEWEEEEEEKRPIDPEIQRKIDYLLKHGGKGAARAFLRELERSGAESPTLDPISASRMPAADREPHYKLRYTNPVFASPSRDTEFRPRLYSMDDQLVGRKYRSINQTVGNFPIDYHGYDSPKSLVHRFRAPKPGYGLAPHSSAHSTADSREAGYFSDTGYVRHTMGREWMRNGGDTTDGETDKETDRETDRETLERRSYYSSQSSMEEYDPTTGLRRSKLRSSTISSEALSTPYMGQYKRSGIGLLKSEAPPQIYEYEQLKITNTALPPDTEINTLERHLSKEEFEKIFHMTREEFYRLAEWKRNDMKKRVYLF